jgi:hypothetical protein
MSTLAYARFASEHPRTTDPPAGLQTYIDIVAALVPAEVLSLHALIVSTTTKVSGATTTIEEFATLKWAFIGLVILSAVFYAVGQRLTNKAWQPRDWFRMGIPPVAFIAWTMLQRATAFDALRLDMTDGARTVIALFIAVILVLFSKWLGDAKAHVPGWLANKPA